MKFKTTIKVFLAIVILVFVIYKMNVSVKDILHSIVDVKYFVLALLFPTFVTTSLSVNRWKTFLSMIGVKEKFWHLVAINFESTFLGLVLPSSQGFDLLRILKIESCHPKHRGKVGSTVVVERLIGLICLLAIAVFSWIYTGSNDSIVSILTLAFIVSIIIFLVYSEQCYTNIQKYLYKIPFAKKVFHYIGRLYEGIHLFPYDRSIIWSIILILLLQLSNILVVNFLFEACGYHIPFIYHLCFQPLISVITMLPLTFGGVGIREGSFAFFYLQCDVPNSVIISVSLLYYFVITLVPAFLGGIIYLFNVRHSKL